MKLGKDFIQWYLNNLCHHSVDSIVIHGKQMMCLRCARTIFITNDLLERYKKDCKEREEFLNGS